MSAVWRRRTIEIGIRPLAIEDYEALVTLWQQAGSKFNPRGSQPSVEPRAGDSLEGSLREAGSWLNLLTSFDAIFLVVAFITFEYVLEE